MIDDTLTMSILYCSRDIFEDEDIVREHLIIIINNDRSRLVFVVVICTVECDLIF